MQKTRSVDSKYNISVQYYQFDPAAMNMKMLHMQLISYSKKRVFC